MRVLFLDSSNARNHEPSSRKAGVLKAADSRGLRKAVIPAAGLGTRLLYVAKEQPKEMLPVLEVGPTGYSAVS